MSASSITDHVKSNHSVIRYIIRSFCHYITNVFHDIHIVHYVRTVPGMQIEGGIPVGTRGTLPFPGTRSCHCTLYAIDECPRSVVRMNHGMNPRTHHGNVRYGLKEASSLATPLYFLSFFK